MYLILCYLTIFINTGFQFIGILAEAWTPAETGNSLPQLVESGELPRWD